MKVIERLFKRPPINISSNGGFSPRNVQSMVQFAREYPDFEIVKQLVSQIHWEHNISLLQKLEFEIAKFTKIAFFVKINELAG